MKKELLTIEFRYYDIPINDNDTEHRNKIVTIGIFDTLNEAIAEGNKCLDILSKSFEVRKDDKFILKHLFDSPKRLVTNTCYPTNNIQYFAHIQTLCFDNLSDTIDEVFTSTNKYKKYRNSLKY
jgi:hypothetical protein